MDVLKSSEVDQYESHSSVKCYSSPLESCFQTDLLHLQLLVFQSSSCSPLRTHRLLLLQVHVAPSDVSLNASSTPPSANTRLICAKMLTGSRYLFKCKDIFTLFSHCATNIPPLELRNLIYFDGFLLLFCKETLPEAKVKRARFISASVVYTDTFKAHFHK